MAAVFDGPAGSLRAAAGGRDGKLRLREVRTGAAVGGPLPVADWQADAWR
ncbi:hypothetical protein [Paractinoplanes rishiriensis]|nr:hypothetical protein [Actinoplanes rishiriensis]